MRFCCAVLAAAALWPFASVAQPGSGPVAPVATPPGAPATATAASAADGAPAGRPVAPGQPGRGGRAGGGQGFGGFGGNPPGPPIPIIAPVPMPAAPATMELLLPAGATAMVDGKDAGTQRVYEFKEFEPNGVHRVEVVVTFAGGAEAKRTVDLQTGWRVRVPVGLPPVDQPATVITESAIAVLWASFSPNGRLIATASENGAVVLWDLSLGRPVRNFSGHRDGVQSVVFSPDGEHLLTASVDKLAVLWNVRTGRLVRRFGGHTGAVNSAVFSADGRRIATGSSDKTAILWDADTGTQLRTFTGHTDEVVGVAISPDGSTIASASTDKNAMLWKADTGEKLHSLRTFDTVSGIAFSPDGKTVAASNFSNNVNLWEAATGKVIAATRRVNLDLTSTAFSPDGRFFFSAGKDATAKFWDGNTRQQLREFTGHGADVQSVAPSPDGRMLLTASRDGTARLFDLATGLELVSLASSSGGRSWVVVAPDGLYDGTEHGRRMIGYRFASKLPGASMDQFFGRHYRPGLLTEIFRGERPMASVQIGAHLPPVLKIVAPKARTTTEEQVVVEVEATDKGGGVSTPQIFNHGARLAIEPETRRDGDVVRFAFRVNLAAGSNQFRVTAASADGSWEALPAEIEVNLTRRPERKGRLFVMAVGVGDYAEPKWNTPPAMADARAIAELLQRRSASLYDRVDVIPLLGRDATRTRITETLVDLASLSQPQDTVMLIVCGRGVVIDGHLYLAPQELRPGPDGLERDFRTQGLDGDLLAAMLGSCRALNRILMFDAAEPAAARVGSGTADFALRAAVERWSRAQGLHAIAACATLPAAAAGEVPRGLLAGLLLEAGSGETPNAMAVMDWFNAAAERAGPVMERFRLDPRQLQQSTRLKSFLLLAGAK